MQQDRRRDPYPWTWEIPLAVAIVVMLELVVGAQLGRALANVVVGAGWTWPAAASEAVAEPFASPIGGTFWSSLPRVLAGDAGAGLTTPIPAGLAGRGMVWGCVALVDGALLTSTAWLSALMYRRWGPGRMRGMATAAEAEKLLGLTRLRAAAPIVRPDLQGSRNGRSFLREGSTPVRVELDAQDDSADARINGEQPGPRLGRGLSPWLLDGRQRARRAGSRR